MFSSAFIVHFFLTVPSLPRSLPFLLSQVILEIEDEFQVAINDEDAAHLVCVNDVIDCKLACTVNRCLDQNGSPCGLSSCPASSHHLRLPSVLPSILLL